MSGYENENGLGNYLNTNTSKVSKDNLNLSNSLLGGNYYSGAAVNYNSPLNIEQSNNLGLFSSLDSSYNPGALGLSTESDANNKIASPWYSNGSALQGYAGLASALMQLYAMPQQMRLAKLQEKGMEQNLSRAEADSATRDAMIANINGHRLSDGSV